MSEFKKRLEQGDVLVLDGAIGTELENHGIEQKHDASWAECIASYPDIIQRVHDDYVKAGADIITTNTYSSGPNALRKIEQAENITSWNTRAVELASMARDKSSGDKEIYIAGSVSAFGNGAMHYRGVSDGINWEKMIRLFLKTISMSK